MDVISITGLTATGFHGVFPEEWLNSQQFIIDVELGPHVETRSDELSNTVDYAGVADLIHAKIEGEPCRLIEILTGRVADRYLSSSLIQQTHITVHKSQAPIPHELSDLSATITRDSHEQQSLWHRR